MVVRIRICSSVKIALSFILGLCPNVYSGESPDCQATFEVGSSHSIQNLVEFVSKIPQKTEDQKFYEPISICSKKGMEVNHSHGEVYRGEGDLRLQPRVDSEYSVNLMWINREPMPEQKWLFPILPSNNSENKFVDKIASWAKLNPNGVVNIWYDSKLVSRDALHNTIQAIEKQSCHGQKFGKIILRDVRSIPQVRENSHLFSPHMNVYFRVDLLRIMAAYHELKTHQTARFVYGDFDMEPLSKEELFDSETVKNLNQVGIVMAKWGEGGVENGFQILSNKPQLLEAIKFAIIDLNIARANRFLEGRLYIPRFKGVFSPKDALLKSGGQEKWKEAGSAISQMVYESYANMFRYLYSLEKRGILKVSNSLKEEEYQKDKHGLTPFGEETSRVIQDPLRFASDSLKIDEYGYPPIPTKQVKLPGSNGNFY